MPYAHEIPCRIATGTYVGDGNATQSITGLSFQPKYVVIYRRFSGQSNFYTKTDRDGVNSLYFIIGGAVYYEADYIISLDSGGFTVGDGTGGTGANQLNNLGVNYTYVCMG